MTTRAERMAALNRREDIRAKKAEIMRAKWADPACRAARSAKISKSVRANPEAMEKRRENGRKVGKHNLPRDAASRAKAVKAWLNNYYSWCPEQYRQHYRKLIANNGFSAAEAREIIEKDIHRDEARRKARTIDDMFREAEAPARPERRQSFSRVYTQTLGGVS